jgi:hypothetical protein
MCPKCALFGVHRLHDVRNEDDVIPDLTERSEKLISVMQDLDLLQKEIQRENIGTTFQ